MGMTSDWGRLDEPSEIAGVYRVSCDFSWEPRVPINR